jgi:hypothetical protein
MTPPIEIKVRVETHYGKHTIYPVCKVAKGLVKLLGGNTIPASKIPALKELGYEIINIYTEEKT